MILVATHCKNPAEYPVQFVQYKKRTARKNPGRLVYKKRTCRLFFNEPFHYGGLRRLEPDEVDSFL